MRDTLEIGTSPFEETCTQVGHADYAARGPKECRAYRNQLRRQFGPEPEGASLKVKGNAHDFGTYYEVACSFDSDNAAAERYAYQIEGNSPARWDDEAKTELGIVDEI